MSRLVRVVAAAIVHEQRCFVARRRDDLARGGLWELPGGKVEPGESDPDALVRELVEELDMQVRPVRLLAESVHDYGDIRVCLVGWLCTWQGGGPTLRDHSEARWLAEGTLHSIEWAPADIPLLEPLQRAMGSLTRRTTPADP